MFPLRYNPALAVASIARGLDNACYNTYYPSMSPGLREELQQKKPFSNLEQEAHLNVVRTAAALHDTFEQILKPHGISGTQYNLLRILRGSEPTGLCRNELRDRMVTRMPDVTRLLDRIEEAGLVVRERSTDDRRQVTTRITARGRRLLDSLDDVAAAEHRRCLGHMSDVQLRKLIELLTLARSQP